MDMYPGLVVIVYTKLSHFIFRLLNTINAQRHPVDILYFATPGISGLLELLIRPQLMRSINLFKRMCRIIILTIRLYKRRKLVQLLSIKSLRTRSSTNI